MKEELTRNLWNTSVALKEHQRWNQGAIWLEVKQNLNDVAW